MEKEILTVRKGERENTHGGGGVCVWGGGLGRGRAGEIPSN